MNKLFLFSAMAVLSMGLFNSCSKDDGGPADTTDYAAKVAGIYKGDMTVSLGGSAEEPTTEKIYMTRTADNKATLEIKNFSYSGLDLGDIKIENVDVASGTKAEAVSCVVSGKGKVTIDLAGAPLTADVTVNGTIVGSKADLNIDVKAVGLNVNVKFDGAKIDQDTPDYARDIANTYSGSMTVSVGAPGAPTSQQITFSREDENVVTMLLKDFSFNGMPLGNITLSGIAVTKTDDTYALAGEGDIQVTLSGAPITAKAELTGTVKEGDADLNIVITVPNLPEITVTFTGSTTPDTTAEMTAISLAGDKVAMQPASEDGSTAYVFYMSADAVANDIKALVPTIAVSEGATVTPASGMPVDFSEGPVTFTVTAQDGVTQTQYTVACGGVRTDLYSFEDWEKYGTAEGVFIPAASTGWSTSIMASMFLPAYGVEVTKHAVTPAAEGYSGKAAEINSIDSRVAYTSTSGFIPAITSGTLFLGTFELNFGNTLKSTRFGNVYTRKPVLVTGYYKYAPGAIMIDNKGQESTAADQCSMTAVLYEVSDPATETLDGTNLTDDSRIVAIKQFTSEAKDEFTPFTMALEYKKDYEPGKTYKFAIVCSSSKNGNQYNAAEVTPLGAGGSSLVVDEISVIAEL